MCLNNNMNLLNLLPLMTVAQAFFLDAPVPRRDLSFLNLAKYDGYNAEEHFVTTADGYILGVFRIPLRENCAENKGPLIFMHGLYLSSDDCLTPGPGKAHCYIYSDNCYDVWAPNIRGNVYSRNHTSYNPNTDKAFWDFSLEELALYDLPAVINYILKTTSNTQLTYVAHSQGVTMLLILCTKMPEYNSKIKVGFGLSPVGWLDNSKFIVIQLEGILEPILTSTKGLLDEEVLARGGLVNSAAKLLCGISKLSYPFCSNLIFIVLGYNKYQITSDVLPVVMTHLPAGTSLKNFNRYGQIRNYGFSEYNYGRKKNLIVYGTPNPPLYDLSKVTMKWVMVASYNDYVANVTDVKLLVSKLSDVSLCTLSDTTFGHLDFVYGNDIPNYITPIILSTLETGSYRCT